MNRIQAWLHKECDIEIQRLHTEIFWEGAMRTKAAEEYTHELEVLSKRITQLMAQLEVKEHIIARIKEKHEDQSTNP